ncbi:MAG: hypothetical protein QM527_03690 [Alphaproteobacteria bacterium]|nr:hypothetical protein [Alphaproteobacteria bacterium]
MRPIFKKIIAGGLLAGVFGVIATGLIDIETDIQGQKIISLYGNDYNAVTSEWETLYNDGVLTIPDEMVCVLRQLWKPELLNQGNVRVEVNEKPCKGNEDGKTSIAAVANLSSGVNGNVIGKFWYDDTQSAVYPGSPDVVVYLKVNVTASPTASEPLGRFTIDAADERKSDGQLLATFRIEPLGNQFKVTGKIPANNTYFAAYADFLNKKAVYKLSTEAGFSAVNPVRLGFNDSHICFQTQGSNEDCFSRDLNAQGVRTNAWAYGIYSLDGSRYTGVVDYVTVDGVIYNLTGGFGSSLSKRDNPGQGNGPGDASRENGDAVFWSNKSATMGAANVPVRLAWLTKTHSVPRATSVRKSSVPNGGTILLDANASNLIDPATLDASVARSIGSLPNVSSQAVRVKSGKLQ